MIDTGVTDTAIRQSDIDDLPTSNHTNKPFATTLFYPNNTTAVSTRSCTLHLGSLTITADIYDDKDLQQSLLSISQCVNKYPGLIASQTNNRAWLTLNNNIIFSSTKQPNDKLWHITPRDYFNNLPAEHQPHGGSHHLDALETSPPHQSNMAKIPNWQSIQQHVNWCHECFGSPAKSTLLQAFDLNYIDFPGVTAAAIRKHLTETFATATGHMVNQRQGNISTNPNQPAQHQPAAMQPAWIPQPPQQTTNTTTIDSPDPLPSSTSPPTFTTPYYDPLDPTAISDSVDGVVGVYSRHDVMHGDASTGLPFGTLDPDGQYILLMIWRGYTILTAITNREGVNYARAYEKGYDELATLNPNDAPQFIRIDNETSKATEQAFANKALTPQFVPPRSHRGLKAERGLRTAKAHLISSWKTVPSSYPADRWTHTLPQIQLTLNLLTPFKPNPSISAYEGVMKKRWSFHLHPFGPVGCRVFFHIKTEGRASYGSRAAEGFYLGPATQGTRMHHVLSETTKTRITTNQLSWQPDVILPPKLDRTTALASAIHDLRTELRMHRGLADFEPDLRHQLSLLITAFADELPPIHPQADERVPAPAPQQEQPLPQPPAPPQPPHQQPEQQQLQPPAQQQQPQLPPAPAQQQPPQHPPQQQQQQPNPPANQPPPAPSAHTVRRTSGPPARPYVSPSAHPPQPPQSAQRVRPTDRVLRATTKRRASNNADTAWYRQQRCARFPSHTEVIPVPPVIGKVLRNEPVTPADAAAWHQHWQQQPHVSHNANSADTDSRRALNVDQHGKPLTPTSAFNGPNGAAWIAQDNHEVEHLFSIGVFTPQQPDVLTATDRPGHYHRVVREKYKNDDDGNEQLLQRVRGTFDNRKAPSAYPVSHNPADGMTTKAWMNKIASEPHRLNFTADLKDMYVKTPNPHLTYIWMPSKHLSAANIARFHLAPFLHDDRLLLRVDKCLFGIPEAGALSKTFLDVTCLHKGGYWEDPLVPGIYTHRTNGTQFLLVTDDMNVLCDDDAAKQHFLATLKVAKYDVTVDHKGAKWLGYTIHRFPDRVELTVPGYVPKLLARFDHRNVKPCSTPTIYFPPDYKAADAQRPTTDDSPPLNAAGILEAQQILGSALWYAQALESPILTACNDIGTEMADPRQSLNAKLDRLLGYLTLHPNSTLVYYKSDMVYHCSSDVSYLSVTKARSRAGGHGFFGMHNAPTFLNGPVAPFSKVLDVVVSSAAEGEYGAAYLCARDAVYMRAIAKAIGYPQLHPTILLCDNTTTVGLANDTVKIAKTKAVDMRFHWLRDRVRQGQFHVQWIAKERNVADFFTKALPSEAHYHWARKLVRLTPINPKRLARTATWRAANAARRRAAHASLTT